MNQLKPRFELRPEKSAAKTNEPTTMLVLARLVSPAAPLSTARPPLNLGLVLDRSGSMAGAKLVAAKRAAAFAVRQLDAADRVSVTTYDDNVETIVPSTPAHDKAALEARINQIQCGSMTALHDGWVAGATQVAAHLEDGRLNRVLLLTDGLANVGETDPRRICAHVQGLAQRGVSTTTLGIGDDFNEDLLETMAGSGDGSYYFIEGAADLERIFAAELSGLMATLGRKVSLGIEPQNGAEVDDVLSDLQKNPLGRLMLSNLVAGGALEVVLQLTIPPLERASDVCLFRLAYDAPDAGRIVMREALALDAVSADEWEKMPCDSVVTDAATRLKLARERREIARQLDEGNVAGARATLRTARATSETIAAMALQREESDSFKLLEREIEEGNLRKASKSSKYDSYRRQRNRE